MLTHGIPGGHVPFYSRMSVCLLGPLAATCNTEFVQARDAKKTWKVPEDSIIKQHMGNLLSEERNAHKLAAEAAGGITGDEASDVGGGSAHDGVKPPGSNEP